MSAVIAMLCTKVTKVNMLCAAVINNTGGIISVHHIFLATY